MKAPFRKPKGLLGDGGFKFQYNYLCAAIFQGVPVPVPVSVPGSEISKDHTIFYYCFISKAASNFNTPPDNSSFSQVFDLFKRHLQLHVYRSLFYI